MGTGVLFPKACQLGVLFPITKLALGGNHKVKEWKRVGRKEKVRQKSQEYKFLVYSIWVRAWYKSTYTWNVILATPKLTITQNIIGYGSTSNEHANFHVTPVLILFFGTNVTIIVANCAIAIDLVVVVVCPHRHHHLCRILSPVAASQMSLSLSSLSSRHHGHCHHHRRWFWRSSWALTRS